MNPLLALVLALSALAAPAQAPPYVTALEGAPASVPSPAAEPDKWLLAFVDVETTGLVPGYHEMIDVGIVMTDLEGKAIDYLLLRIQPKHPERTSPGARTVNAFDPERWEKLGALAPEAAVERIVSFHRSVARDRHVLMVAYNSQFDAAFLDQLFRSANRSWREIYHYFVLDLPSMAWSLGFRDLSARRMAGRLGVPDEPLVPEEHTGLTGAELNARVYRALLDKFTARTSAAASQ